MLNFLSLINKVWWVCQKKKGLVAYNNLQVGWSSSRVRFFVSVFIQVFTIRTNRIVQVFMVSSFIFIEYLFSFSFLFLFPTFLFPFKILFFYLLSTFSFSLSLSVLASPLSYFLFMFFYKNVNSFFVKYANI